MVKMTYSVIVSHVFTCESYCKSGHCGKDCGKDDLLCDCISRVAFFTREGYCKYDLLCYCKSCFLHVIVEKIVKDVLLCDCIRVVFFTRKCNCKDDLLCNCIRVLFFTRECYRKDGVGAGGPMIHGSLGHLPIGLPLEQQALGHVLGRRKVRRQVTDDARPPRPLHNCHLVAK